MRQLLFSLFFIALATQVGCGGRGKPETLGQLRYEKKKEEKIQFQQMDHQEVRKEYEELLDLFEDETLKEQIERRIADVYMMEGVQDQLKNEPRKSYYVEAIKSYREILEKYPDSPDNAEVFYQLAKAYDMEGNQDEALLMLSELTRRHPTYKNISEAWFRMGDIYFNKQKYQQAERAYTAVTQSQNEKLALNARYMLGWSHYKQLKFDEALSAFADVLSEVLADKSSLDQLSKTERPFAEDSLHSISLTLARSGGADMIASAPQLSNKHYIWMIYEDLGEYYLEKERFEDSAYTYRLFVTQHRHSDQAPRLHKRLIDSYIEGGFPFRAIEEKETYVAFYGINSNYKGNVNGVRDDLKPSLKQYIDELAKNYHSEAQSLQKSLQEVADEKIKMDAKKRKETKGMMIASFGRAAELYQEYIDTFPVDERVGEMTFLKAEAYYSAFMYEKAIYEYEKVAYQLKDKGHREHGADAGYAAIISYQSLIEPLKPGSRDAQKWQKQAVDSMLRFAEVFHADKRSPSVLTNAAEYLFSLNQYQRALEVSQGLIANNVSLDKSLKKTAYGIIAHSYFKLDDFQNAEDNYLNQRQLVNQDDEEYEKITERLAAAIYRKSEGLIAQGNQVEAITELLKIKRLAPETEIRITAQYDAATMLLELERWQEAVVEFLEMKSLYPEHKLAVEFPRKIAFSYEKMADWTKAGDSYLELYRTDPDPEVRREALFLAATMFENDQQYEAAIDHFKRYAHLYEQPFSTRMEARYHLALNYERIDDKTRHLYWLRRVVAGDEEGGSDRTERSRWLGAWANAKYGDYFAWEFNRKRLYLPLDKSIARKNGTLKDAVGRYQMAADYGILEFVSMSSYKIAELYRTFSQELRAAPMPKGLSADQRTMYKQILDEQATPFVELAEDLHHANLELAWGGKYNTWIEQSFIRMRELKPERYAKYEYEVSYGDEIQ